MRKLIFTVAVSIASMSVAHADQLVFSAEKSGNNRIAALDYVSDGDAVSFLFRIDVPGGTAARVNLKSCVASLPKSHAGQCNFSNGQIIGLVYSDTNERLPKGIISVGQISTVSDVAGDLKVAHFEAANGNGEMLEAKVAASTAK